jgi:hypothetical protein
VGQICWTLWAFHQAVPGPSAWREKGAIRPDGRATTCHVETDPDNPVLLTLTLVLTLGVDFPPFPWKGWLKRKRDKAPGLLPQGLVSPFLGAGYGSFGKAHSTDRRDGVNV